MPCLSGFTCTPVLTRNDGQCPEAYCDTGLMTAGTGRTTVTMLTCNGLQQWVDPQMTVYSIAQCETSCTCPPLTITPSPNVIPTRGNALGADAAGCSTIVSRCSRNDIYRLVTADGVVTLEPPAAQNTAMTSCTTCNTVRTGPGVITTLAYDPTSWCKQYVLSGCPNGYKVGNTVIGTTLTCSDRLRWSSGSFQGPIGGSVSSFVDFSHRSKEIIEEVGSYVYPGQEVSTSNDLANEISRRIEGGWLKFNEEKEVLLSKIAPKRKAEIFNTTVLSAMIYGCETWAPTRDERRRLETTARAMESAMLSITL
ncbi:hypothetical protein ANCDUO_09491 [Ancylostoma duodenale]|uniref:Uncharacterized protein n=1 Tax=Ancylostoma duodenale TaxID=51022 RepID=A0A0C2GGG5_9BILA|nr:hypothetical protein ANCDUO_09491 [Ancylostoma duodenale]